MDFPANITEEQLEEISPLARAMAKELGITHFVLDESAPDMGSCSVDGQECDLFGHDGDPDHPQPGQRTWWWEPETTTAGGPQWKRIDDLICGGP